MNNNILILFVKDARIDHDIIHIDSKLYSYSKIFIMY